MIVWSKNIMWLVLFLKIFLKRAGLGGKGGEGEVGG